MSTTIMFLWKNKKIINTFRLEKSVLSEVVLTDRCLADWFTSSFRFYLES